MVDLARWFSLPTDQRAVRKLLRDAKQAVLSTYVTRLVNPSY